MPDSDTPPQQNQDLTGFARRLEEHRDAALRFAFRMLGDIHDAEEVVQDTFIRLLQKAGSFRGESALRTYVLAAVRNGCIDRRRRELTQGGSRREINPASTAFFRRLTPGSRFLGVSTQVQMREARDIIRAAIDLLPEKQRACMVLHDLEGLAYKEVGEVLGITANYVGVLLYQARLALRTMIEEGRVIDVR